MPEVVIPWRGGCPHRERAKAWVQARYHAIYPVWELTTREAAPGPWVKASAVNPAVREAASEIVIVADADVWTDGIAKAVWAVENGAPWAIPHDKVFRLDEEGTAAVLAGEDWQNQPVEQMPYRGLFGGGILVAPRQTLIDVPLDPRFVGWGQEDESWGLALYVLAGMPWRGEESLVHLWHPPQPRVSRARGSRDSWNLRRRYLRSRKTPDDMRSLLNEIEA